MLRPGTGARWVSALVRLAVLLGMLCPAVSDAQVLQTIGHDAGPEIGQRPHLKAHEGLQMAVSTGLRFPMGDATEAPGDSLGARYSYQLPLVLDIGFKVTPDIHVGAYLGMAYGAEGNADVVEDYCDDDDGNLDNDIGCSTAAYKAGVQGQYHIAPGAQYNPWVGYGFGIETIHQTLHDKPRGYEETTQTTGLTLAKLNLGVDYRGRSGVGMGLFSEASLGRFMHSRTEINGAASYAGGVENAAYHLWVGAGFRVVLFP